LFPASRRRKSTGFSPIGQSNYGNHILKPAAEIAGIADLDLITLRRTCVTHFGQRANAKEGLEQEFNSLDAQREAGEAYIASQRSQGWVLVEEHYDNGGFTGASLERPALARLLGAVRSGQVDCVVVYKVDRLSRSLLDFAQIMALFEEQRTSFVSVTQQFNTTTSLGRLTLNILSSFAQFERELIGERTRDKMWAAKKKGKWVGGFPPLGYDVAAEGGRLVVRETEAERVREIFQVAAETLHNLRRLAVRGHENRNPCGRWAPSLLPNHTGPPECVDRSTVHY
jgi:site-specific DNA recombinase